jgi:hypothetical protein
MKTGNISGNSKCEKWELACDKPTSAMMMESSRKGALAGGIDWAERVVVMKSRSQKTLGHSARAKTMVSTMTRMRSHLANS